MEDFFLGGCCPPDPPHFDRKSGGLGGRGPPEKVTSENFLRWKSEESRIWYKQLTISLDLPASCVLATCAEGKQHPNLFTQAPSIFIKLCQSSSTTVHRVSPHNHHHQPAPSSAINRNQPSSTVINRHQSSSNALKNHPISTKLHQASPTAANQYPSLSTKIQQSIFIEDYHNPPTKLHAPSSFAKLLQTPSLSTGIHQSSPTKLRPASPLFCQSTLANQHKHSSSFIMFHQTRATNLHQSIFSKLRQHSACPHNHNQG